MHIVLFLFFSYIISRVTLITDIAGRETTYTTVYVSTLSSPLLEHPARVHRRPQRRTGTRCPSAGQFKETLESRPPGNVASTGLHAQIARGSFSPFSLPPAVDGHEDDKRRLGNYRRRAWSDHTATRRAHDSNGLRGRRAKGTTTLGRSSHAGSDSFWDRANPRDPPCLNSDRSCNLAPRVSSSTLSFLIPFRSRRSSAPSIATGPCRCQATIAATIRVDGVSARKGCRNESQPLLPLMNKQCPWCSRISHTISFILTAGGLSECGCIVNDSLPACTVTF